MQRAATAFEHFRFLGAAARCPSPAQGTSSQSVAAAALGADGKGASGPATQELIYGQKSKQRLKRAAACMQNDAPKTPKRGAAGGPAKSPEPVCGKADANVVTKSEAFDPTAELSRSAEAPRLPFIAPAPGRWRERYAGG